jgi:hypothetical protein
MVLVSLSIVIILVHGNVYVVSCVLSLSFQYFLNAILLITVIFNYGDDGHVF